MYPRYNMYGNYGNIRRNNRFFGGGFGFAAPFLLGGALGYAFGTPRYNNFYYPYPYYPSYYSNNYYY